MPADVKSVNLLDNESLEDSPIGRIVNWAITFGRYIMITTEIVVLLAFVSRFSLDRKLTDLNEAIAQKQAIIEANIDFESDFIALKEKINRIKTLIDNQEMTLNNLKTVKVSLPEDVYLNKLDVSQNAISGTAVAYSASGFAAFIYKLQEVEKFNNITLGEIKKDPLKGLVFTFTTDSTKQKVEKPKPESNDQNSSNTEASDGI